MTVLEITLAVKLDVSTFCYQCDCLVPMSPVMLNNLRANHNAFYCINGHAQSFRGESEADRLRKKLHESDLLATRRANALAAAVASQATAEAALKKSSTRTKAGVCSCCNRTFKQLAAHMKNKHPTV